MNLPPLLMAGPTSDMMDGDWWMAAVMWLVIGGCDWWLVRNVRNVGGDGNGWRENSKFGEKNIEGFSKNLGRTYQKKGATGIERVTSTSKHQKLNHLRPWVFYAYKLFYIPLIDYLFILLQNLNN